MRATWAGAARRCAAWRACAFESQLFGTPLCVGREALREHLLMSLERLELRSCLARVRRVLGDARNLRGKRVRVAEELLRLLALDLVALVALDLLLLHLLLVRHHGVRT